MFAISFRHCLQVCGAFGADLRGERIQPGNGNKTIDEYLDRLCGYVHEVTRELPVCSPKEKMGPRKT